MRHCILTLNIIKNDLLGELLEKGPTYRERNATNYDKVREAIKSGINARITTRAAAPKFSVELNMARLRLPGGSAAIALLITRPLLSEFEYRWSL